MKNTTHAPPQRSEAVASSRRPQGRSVAAQVLHMQRTAGNRAVAEFVVQRRAPCAGRCACGAPLVDGRECQQCRNQRRGGPPTAPRTVHEVLRSPGRPLQPSTRQFFEQRFGDDFSDVRVHTDDRAIRSATGVGALAYTVGRHIVIPETPSGHPYERVLAHELAHVAAHGSRADSDIPATLQISRPDSAAEVAAERAGTRALGADSRGVRAPADPSAIGTVWRWTIGGCGGERPVMNPEIIGVVEHTLIQQDYVQRFNPSALPEYGIPEGNCNTGNKGWADLVEPDRRTIYEIKADSYSGQQSGREEVACYVFKATEHCGGSWTHGTNYAEHDIWMGGDEVLHVRLAEPGVILYQRRRRRRQTQKDLVYKIILLGILAAIAAAKQAGKKAPGKVGGPILAAIQALAAVAVLVLVSKQAQAGERAVDEDPLVALAQMLDDSGQTMPPELRKLLDEHPELRELIRLEVERRRREGGRTSPQGQGTAGGSRAPAGAASGGAPAASVLPAAVGGVPSVAGKKTPQPALDAPGATHTAPPAANVAPPTVGSAPPTKSYEQTLQERMDQHDWSSLGANQSYIEWPPAANLAVPGTQFPCFVYGRSAGRRYLFLMTVETLGVVDGVPSVRVVWTGRMLVDSPRQFVGAPGEYRPGKIVKFPPR
jgi:hypothetical protein